MTTAYDEHGVAQVEDFPYDEIDERAGHFKLPDDVTLEDLAKAAVAMQKIMDWVWQGGPRNLNGFEIRSAIACWIFLKHLHALNLTQFSAMMNKDKQSLGRWVDDFKKQFPAVKTEHMRV